MFDDLNELMGKAADAYRGMKTAAEADVEAAEAMFKSAYEAVAHAVHAHLGRYVGEGFELPPMNAKGPVVVAHE